jgi:hypothetical protein
MALPLLGLLGGVIGAVGASSAAKKQASAAEADREAAERIYYDQKQMFAPYRNSGVKYNNALNYENGFGSKPAGYRGFQETPGYQFQLKEGLGAVEGGAAARGGLMSGAAMKALQARGQGIANNEYNNFIARLTQGTNRGIQGAGMTGSAGQNFVANNSNALAGIGNAGAAGSIGVSNALNQGIGQATSLYNYQNNLNGGNDWFGGGFGAI